MYPVSKAVLRFMTKARWGRIVNVSSVVASMGMQVRSIMLPPKQVLKASLVRWLRKLPAGDNSK